MIITRLLRAENGTRTRDLNLGKVALYQLSYFRNLFCRLAYCECKGNEKLSISKFFIFILQFFYNCPPIVPFRNRNKEIGHNREVTDPFTDIAKPFVDKIDGFV